MPLATLRKAADRFDPETLKIMIAAFEQARTALKLASRSDPVTILLAKKVIELTVPGERDPDRICQSVLQALLHDTD